MGRTWTPQKSFVQTITDDYRTLWDQNCARIHIYHYRRCTCRVHTIIRTHIIIIIGSSSSGSNGGSNGIRATLLLPYYCYFTTSGRGTAIETPHHRLFQLVWIPEHELVG